MTALQDLAYVKGVLENISDQSPTEMILLKRYMAEHYTIVMVGEKMDTSQLVNVKSNQIVMVGRKQVDVSSSQVKTVGVWLRETLDIGTVDW